MKNWERLIKHMELHRKKQKYKDPGLPGCLIITGLVMIITGGSVTLMMIVDGVYSVGFLMSFIWGMIILIVGIFEYIKDRG